MDLATRNGFVKFILADESSRPFYVRPHTIIAVTDLITEPDFSGVPPEMHEGLRAHMAKHGPMAALVLEHEDPVQVRGTAEEALGVIDVYMQAHLDASPSFTGEVPDAFADAFAPSQYDEDEDGLLA